MGHVENAREEYRQVLKDALLQSAQLRFYRAMISERLAALETDPLVS